MSDSLMTDLRHFGGPDDTARLPEPARRLRAFLNAIVERVTKEPEGVVVLSRRLVGRGWMDSEELVALLRRGDQRPAT
jgi:hypothetical protein